MNTKKIIDQIFSESEEFARKKSKIYYNCKEALRKQIRIICREKGRNFVFKGIPQEYFITTGTVISKLSYNPPKTEKEVEKIMSDNDKAYKNFNKQQYARDLTETLQRYRKRYKRLKAKSEKSKHELQKKIEKNLNKPNANPILTKSELIKKNQNPKKPLFKKMEMK